MGLTLYVDDYDQRFPFTPRGYPRLTYIEVWGLLQPYVSTNGSFWRCPLERGPFSIAYPRDNAALGIRTHEVPLAASYLYFPGIHTDWKSGSPVPKGSRLSDVSYPSQKGIVACSALSDPRRANSNSQGPAVDAHGRWKLPCLFVDGHSAVARLDRFRPDPSVSKGYGPDWSSPGWADWD